MLNEFEPEVAIAPFTPEAFEVIKVAAAGKVIPPAPVIEVDPANPTKALFSAGVAGAEGFVKVSATLPSGQVLEGVSEMVKLTTSEAVSFTLRFGEPV